VHTFNGTYADLGIAPDGTINLINPRPPAVQDYGFVSLEGVTYQPSSTIPVTNVILAVNWSGNAGYGSTQPVWYTDPGGVVHLQGAATQVSSGGSSPNLIGTLPVAARPNRNVYTVVHTFNGTYADLGIAPDGTINLINPRPPAVQDYGFVSLEGVTYPK
jgi:hypothetical protein